MSRIATPTEDWPFWIAQVRRAPTSSMFHWASKNSSLGVNVVVWDLRTMPLGSA